MNKTYPYLGKAYINEKMYVVLFLEEEVGVVVVNETSSPNIKFGKYGSFNEAWFEPLKPDECVRLSN